MPRAVLFAAPRLVEVVDVDFDPPPGEGRLLVRTMWSGISSGTEMLAYRGELDPDVPRDEAIGSLRGTFRYPFRYGYSCVGAIEGGGGGLVFAFHPHQDRFVVPASDVVALPAGLDGRAATLFPLVETALQISLDAGAVAHETVAVTGLGAVGLLTALLLKRAGARVTASDPLDWRREIAAEVGVEAVVPDDLASALRGGVHLAVEVSGEPSALAGLLALMDHEGEVLVASWYGAKHVTLPLGGDFHRRRLSLRSTQVSTIPSGAAGRWTVARRRQVAAELLRELPLGALATHAFPFERASDAYSAVDRRESGLVHAALCYQ